MKADKKLGQHFLVDEEARQNIATLILSNAKDNDVLEIGPGMGAITNILFHTLKENLICIELDPRCVEYLNSTYLHLKVIHEDFLASNYLAKSDTQIVICGNFPYNISTEIVFKVIEFYTKIPIVVGMFQKEVAMRLAAKPGSKVYGITSVLSQFFYEVHIEMILPPSAFSPPPKVDSAVITMRRKASILDDISYQKLSILVKKAFNQRRKMLRNALKSLQLPEICIEKYGTLRAEQLSLEDYCAMTKMMQ